MDGGSQREEVIIGMNLERTCGRRNNMKYIAFYGAWGLSILSLMITAIMLGTLICNMGTQYDSTEGILRTIAIPICLFISVASAWVVCDMKKRMKEL